MPDGQKTCFVVMGFEEKPDLQPNPNRILNLNKTFEYIIEPAVEKAGLACIRGDKIEHSGVIDKPMYEHLLNADVVVADLSTSNPNAIYELGVRHALRPSTTIVMAESGFSFPFDLHSLNILKYQHSGQDILYGEVDRVRKELTRRLQALAEGETIDSPVYTFLPTLSRAATVSIESSTATDRRFAELTKSFQQAKASSDWVMAMAFLTQLRDKSPQDPYILQQLAFATYKSEQPDNATALRKAREILAPLSPTTTADTETMDLWATIHEQLWESGSDRSDLDESICAYERGFILNNSYANGINYAFMLDVRASITDGDSSVADRVFARRTRTRVLRICGERLRAKDLPPLEAFAISFSESRSGNMLNRRNHL